ncbi:MAG: class I SAM-dependent methyltransferase [Candidatus Heimdallarchaeota archaeon]
MGTKNEKNDKHFSLFSHKISRLFEPSKRFVESYVEEGMVVADLGCGPGYYSLHFAEILGPEGKVLAVDSDEKSIQALEKKKDKQGYHNIETFASTASDLSFIEDSSVDFVFAYGMICCMAPQEHESAVKEINRILKPSGLAFLSISKGSSSYMSKDEWEKILGHFKVEKRKNKLTFRTAEVRKR